MIYAVTERYDNNSERFFFDGDKVDRNQAFESAYLDALVRAVNMPDRTLLLVGARGPIEARFGEYQNGTSCWEHLLVRPPCRVDAELTLVMSE